MSKDGYRGNPLLKRSGYEVHWTKDRQAEWIKCSLDPIYFIENYIQIVHVDRGLVPFKMYDYQVRITESLIKNRNTIVATARQAGKSTTVVGYILWAVIFQEHYKVALLANKASTARQLHQRIQLAFQHLPKWLQQGIVEWNKSTTELENGSKIVAEATSSDAIRGDSVNLLFIDEAAHIDNWEEFFTSVYPTISSGESTKVVLVSTPKGLNHFYKTWKGAEESKNSYNPIKVMWHEVPGRGEAWKEATLKALDYDMQKFNQEYCVEFLGSSNTLINGATLTTLVDQTPVAENNYGLKIYEKPQEGHIYTIICDVSRGKLLDHSAFSVVDITQMPYKQVATFRNNELSPAEYSEVIFQIASNYNNAYVLVEINDIGGEVANLLLNEYEYEYLVYTSNNGRSGKRAVTGFGGGTTELGIRTTKTVKNIGCSTMKLLIEQTQLIINDFDTIHELSRFSRKGVSYEAESGCTDDLVMGLVLFSWFTTQDMFKNFNDINTIAKLREISEEQIEQQLTPIGFDSINWGEPEEQLVEMDEFGFVKDIWVGPSSVF